MTSLTSQKINKDCKQLGFLSESRIKTEKDGYTIGSLVVESSTSQKSLGHHKYAYCVIYWLEKLRSVACLSNDDIWTCGSDLTRGNFKTAGGISKVNPNRVRKRATGHSSGNLLYPDYHDIMVNILTNHILRQ